MWEEIEEVCFGKLKGALNEGMAVLTVVAADFYY